MTKFRYKAFTQWDETDNLKRMKDSDILAEQKKTVSSGNVWRGAAGGAIAGAGIGSVLGGALAKGNSAGFIKGGKYGALAGGILAGAAAMKANKQQAKENQFYNNRLEYAQRQARRRERKDWKTNMTQRDGYSY